MKKVNIILKNDTTKADAQVVLDSKLVTNFTHMEKFDLILGEIESDDVKDQLLKFDCVDMIEDSVERYLITPVNLK